MKVAVVSDMIRPNGAGVMALAAAEMLADEGVEVGVFAGAMSSDLESSLSTSYLTAQAFTNEERALDGSVTSTDHHAFRVALLRWLREALADFAPDVISVHNCGRILSQLELMALSKEYPVAFTMHDEWFTTDAHYTFLDPTGAQNRTYEPGVPERVIEHEYEHLFEIPKAAGTFTAIGPSRWLTDRAKQVFPTLDITHLPNAVDTSLFELQDRVAARERLGLAVDVPVVLFVGSPTQPRKGFRAFEHACRSVEPAPVRLVAGGHGSVATGGAEQFVSPGPIRDRLDVYTTNPVGDLDIQGPGLVIAGLDRTLIPTLYGAADVLVHPSRIDNLPTVPIEAGLAGTKCLASNVGGTRETIADLEDLFEIDHGAEALSERITSALEAVKSETNADRQRRRDAQLERFGVAGHKKALVSIFESLIERRAASEAAHA